ncbi:MAG: GGDEF domain-containing protein [Nitrospirae bacterium]|nr:GGDEF domain-containing protein [Nitrospirota bacterium]
MLPTAFTDRLSQMMGVKMEEIAQETQEAFSRDSAEAASRGLIHSSNTLGLYQRRRVQQIDKRVKAVLECQKRLISAVRLPFSETLASELKAQSEEWVTPEWCEQSVQSDPDLGLIKDYKTSFREETLQARNSALRKASIEIDLLLDELRPQSTTQAPVNAKELDQKFKILLSPDQVKKDFNEWTEKLGPVNGHIAVLFIDLDKFKALNTKYTEPRIDQDFLPDAMNLVESFVRVRGEAAKHGGDEYVVILPNHDATDAVAFSEKLRRAFEQHKFVVAGDDVRITVSIGVGLWPLHGSNYEEVLTKSSAAKQTAKADRNKVVLAQAVSEQVLPLPKSGLSPAGQTLALFLNQRSQAAEEADPILGPEIILANGQLTEEELTIAADELHARGWLTTDVDGSKIGFRYIQPTPFLFFETDPDLRGWDPRQDAKTVAVVAVGLGKESLSPREIGEKLGWEPRRLNPAMSWLENRGFAKLYSAMGASPYRFTGMFITPSTRRLASET